jgi:hypothetical protein
MMVSPEEQRALANTAARAEALEAPLRAVEDQLTALGLALHRQDAAAVEQVAAGLHAALAAAVDHFQRAAKSGGVPSTLRQRLAQAGGQVAAQREALARATASLDRAIDVLIPRLAATGVYSSAGAAERSSHGLGSLMA